MLGRHRPSPLPGHNIVMELAANFNDYFLSKPIFLRKKLSQTRPGVLLNLPNFSHISSSITTLSTFTNFTTADVKKSVLASTYKSSPSDPIPTQLIRKNLSSLLPTITNIMYCVMEEGMASIWKHSVVFPLLKKVG
jgi:hypothetical protein